MAEYIWVGGASTVAQVQTDEFTGTTWTGGATLTATFTDENGSTQTVTLGTTNVTEEVQRDLFLITLQQDTQSLPSAVTFTSSSTDTIVSTAKVPGIPFYLVISENDGAGGITEVKDGSGSSVLSEGPEDRNTDGDTNYNSTNWRTAQGANSLKPADGAHNVKFNQGFWSMRYGLNDTRGFNEVRITQGYTGTIGDPAAGFYWIADVDNASAQALYIDKVQGDVWMTTIGENAYITGTAAGANAVKFGAASDFTGVRVIGQGVQGTITCPTGMALDNIVMTDCPRAFVSCGAVTSLDRVDVGAGRCELTMAAQTVAVRMQTWGGGTIIHNSNNSGGTVLLAEVYGGRMEYNGQGTLTNLKVYGGEFTLDNSTADLVTIATTNQYGGNVSEGGMQNATWSNFYRQGGGGNVSATINQWGTATD